MNKKRCLLGVLILFYGLMAYAWDPQKDPPPNKYCEHLVYTMHKLYGTPNFGTPTWPQSAMPIKISASGGAQFKQFVASLAQEWYEKTKHCSYITFKMVDSGGDIVAVASERDYTTPVSWDAKAIREMKIELTGDRRAGLTELGHALGIGYCHVCGQLFSPLKPDCIIANTITENDAKCLCYYHPKSDPPRDDPQRDDPQRDDPPRDDLQRDDSKSRKPGTKVGCTCNFTKTHQTKLWFIYLLLLLLVRFRNS
jgi:hypothetical protein